MNRLVELLQKLISFLNISVKNLPTPQGKSIYDCAVSQLGKDASPNDIAPDEFGCAETVSTILIKAGCDIPVIVSTAELYKWFVQSDSWLEVPQPLAGDVIISPTGMGGKNGITNGHTGIVGYNNTIMSNNSNTGLFTSNYTIAGWEKRYKITGGYPVFYFRKIA